MTQDPADKAARAVNRKLANARRETQKAVERFAKIDALTGHRVEALRRAREVRDAADAAVRFFDAER